MNAQVLGLVNQKGGVTKSTSCVNLAAGLAQAGKKVLAVDLDPQASLTISLGHPQPDKLPVTISDMMGKVLTDQPITPGEAGGKNRRSPSERTSGGWRKRRSGWRTSTSSSPVSTRTWYSAL